MEYATASFPLGSEGDARSSSFARVRRVLVSHIMEEGEEQENEKEDEREDGQQRVEGRVVEKQTNHIMSA